MKGKKEKKKTFEVLLPTDYRFNPCWKCGIESPT